MNLNRESNLDWCVADSEQLVIRDLNGDGQNDMLCHNRSSGYKWIVLALADEPISGTSW